MKYIKLILIGLVVLGFTYLGVSSIVKHDNQIKLKEIQLKDSSAKLKELNEQYNQLLQEKEVDSNKLQELDKQKQELEKQLQAKLEKQEAERVALEQKSKQITTASATVKASNTVSADKYSILAASGIAPADFQAVDYIISKESGWRHLAVNSSSGATGLCQSLPASKMASAGADYLTNPVTQLKWCDGYAKSRYGGWWPAYNFWQANHWW